MESHQLSSLKSRTVDPQKVPPHSKPAGAGPEPTSPTADMGADFVADGISAASAGVSDFPVRARTKGVGSGRMRRGRLGSGCEASGYEAGRTTNLRQLTCGAKLGDCNLDELLEEHLCLEQHAAPGCGVGWGCGVGCGCGLGGGCGVGWGCGVGRCCGVGCGCGLG